MAVEATSDKWKGHSVKQDDAVFSKKKILALLTGIQWGKGLPLDALILTPNGYRRADSIAVGDTLYDRDGIATKVTGIFPQGTQPCFRITFTDRKSLITDASHLNVLRPRCGRPERVMSTIDLFAAKHLWGLARVPATMPIALPTKKFLIPPYVMGVLLGDGYIKQHVGFSSGDVEIVERVQRELGSNYVVRHTDRNDYVVINAVRKTTPEGYPKNPLIDELNRLGLMGCGSASKFVPDEYKFCNPWQRLEVLRGLMDTDGTISNKNGKKVGRKIEYYSISRELAEGVVWLVESLGGKAWALLRKNPKYTHKGEQRIGKPCFRVNIILPNANPFWLKRKAERYFAHENTVDKVIASVEPVDPRETVCFSVDSPTRTYIANDQIVTHNTQTGAIRMKIRMHQYTDEEDNFIIAAPSYKIMQQSTLPAFLKIMDGLGTYNKVEACFKMHGGGTCYMRTATEPDSIVGIRNVRHIWIDEAGKVSLYFWENAVARSAFRDCQIDLTSSPYSFNWVFKEIVRPKMKNSSALPNVDLIQAASWDNPYFPMGTIEHAKQTMDPRRFGALFGGLWEKQVGLVYDCFDENENVCNAVELPTGTKFVAGIDWGFTHPFAMHIRAITPTNMHYQVGEVHKSGLTITQIVDICRQKQIVFNIEKFYCDPAQPAHIEELCRNGMAAVAADNNVQLGIDRHYELIKTRRFKIFKGVAPHALDEYEVYRYAEADEISPNKDLKDRGPVKQNDDACDAARYTSIMTYTGNKRVAPKVPEEKKREFSDTTLNWMKQAAYGSQTEKWS